MATPVVSAIAGLMLSKNPNLTPVQIRNTIQHTAEDRGDPGRDIHYGWGRVNAYYALLAVVGPQNFRTTNSNNSNVNLAWDPIPSSVLQHYELEKNINGWGWTLIATTTSHSFTDDDFQRNKFGNDVAQYRVRSKTIDNVYSLYSNILTVTGTSFIQQKYGVNIQQAPKEYSLSQNYPNPFNPTTTIGFTLEKTGMTTLKIYDAIGREVATLVNEVLDAGVYHQKQFNASKLASGIYFARLVSDGKVQIKKLMLMK